MISERIKTKFFEMVEKTQSCWIWKGSKNTNGYGKLSSRYAHRLSFEIHTGKEIPDGMNVCHHCDNPECVNPLHLFVGTQKENMQDMINKGRQVKKDNTGYRNPMYGKKHSESALEKMASAKRGKYVGSLHPRASISEETVEEIRKLRRDGLTAKQISELTGASFHVVRNIIYGKSWK